MCLRKKQDDRTSSREERVDGNGKGGGITFNRRTLCGKKEGDVVWKSDRIRGRKLTPSDFRQGGGGKRGLVSSG